jgi:hypothetical protein
MRFLAGLLVSLCLMALAIGASMRTTAAQPVPLSRVDPTACTNSPNGPAVAATETSPGVFAVRCQDGVVVLAGNR